MVGSITLMMCLLTSPIGMSQLLAMRYDRTPGLALE